MNRLPNLVAIAVGIGALVYALWPPDIAAPYLTLAGSLLGVPALGAARE